jgi:2-deoxy-D-gluconate 3-dehydrogenase
MSDFPLSLFDVGGRVVIITGGAGLLGRQYVECLSLAGAHAVIADADGEAAQALARNVRGAAALPVRTDVSDQGSVKTMVSRVLDEYGRIDALVNNAALDPKFDSEHASEHVTAFEDFPLEMWNRGLGVNLTGAFLCCQAVSSAMLSQHRGVIVNVSSTYGMVGPDQRLYSKSESTVPDSFKPVVYSATKSAMLGLTRYLATYWAAKGIRVNSLTPGGVFNDHDEEFVRRYSWRTPMGRMASKEEYCGALLFLLSDASSYMTGANLVVDGGWTAW